MKHHKRWESGVLSGKVLGCEKVGTFSAKVLGGEKLKSSSFGAEYSK